MFEGSKIRINLIKTGFFSLPTTHHTATKITQNNVLITFNI